MPSDAHLNLVTGQVVEFLLWADLEGRSGGNLHVFLPLHDKGVDAIVHRRSDGAFLKIQCKGRSRPRGGYLHFLVAAESVADDEVVVIGTYLRDDLTLAPTVLVVDASNFKKLADPETSHGRPMLSATVPLRPTRAGKWSPFLVPLEHLAAHLSGAPGVTPAERERDHTGFRGEIEVLQQLAKAEHLNLFRAFPDLETVEIAVLNTTNHRVVGLQIKTVTVDARRVGRVAFLASSFRPSPTTFMVVLALHLAHNEFDAQIVFIPTVDVARIATRDGVDLGFNFHPSPTNTGGVVDPYRRRLVDLPALVSSAAQGDEVFVDL